MFIRNVKAFLLFWLFLFVNKRPLFHFSSLTRQLSFKSILLQLKNLLVYCYPNLPIDRLRDIRTFHSCDKYLHIIINRKKLLWLNVCSPSIPNVTSIIQDDRPNGLCLLFYLQESFFLLSENNRKWRVYIRIQNRPIPFFITKQKLYTNPIEQNDSGVFPFRLNVLLLCLNEPLTF